MENKKPRDTWHKNDIIRFMSLFYDLFCTKTTEFMIFESVIMKNIPIFKKLLVKL